ncbi:unnamed protein product [Somion occarium]|uniref:GmrSD restriction endonucleases N-terminal domain-containing protein n=1 Tax=Somion occarium TaxID=3059160 RepID=A0ABP1DHV9_9APHY
MHVGKQLTVPVAKMYTAQDLHILIHEGIIDLCPPYQRDVVWTEAKQTKLLDSLYRNFYVPPIVMVVMYEDGHRVMRCVDGKQRLTSIQKFMDGQLPYRDPFTKKAFYYTLPRSKPSRLQVPQKMREEFALKKITVVEYVDLDPAMERDIFQRVQLGMPLTAAEKLQAVSSAWATWISEIDSRYMSCENGITDIVNVDIKRGRNFQSLAHLVYCCYGVPEQLTPTPSKLETFLTKTSPPDPEFKSSIVHVLNDIMAIAMDKNKNKAFTYIKHRIAPIEFVFMGVVLFVMMKHSTEKQRAEEIYNMRTFIREKYQDVRARGDIIRTLWMFVSDIARKYRTGYQFDKPAPARKTKKKRTRADEDDDSEDEFDGTKRVLLVLLS